MSERYQGGYITATVVNPDGPIADSATATGVWTLPEQFTFHKAGLWPKINARGLVMGGNTESPFTYYDIIDFITIASTANATDFGNLSVAGRYNHAVASETRAVNIGGITVTDGEAVNVIEYVTIASTGNMTDFGDTSEGARSQGAGGVGSKTRGVYAGGRTEPAGTTDEIGYITIASTGDSTDFGNLQAATTNGGGGGCSPTRGVFMFADVSPTGRIDYITIASTGNATDFGDLSNNHGEGAYGCSSNLRAINRQFSVLEYITIASTGNMTDFGDPLGGASSSTSRLRWGAGFSNNTLGIFAGGEGQGNTSGYKDQVEYVTIATTGNTADYSDLTQARGYCAGTSQGHGGHQ